MHRVQLACAMWFWNILRETCQCPRTPAACFHCRLIHRPLFLVGLPFLEQLGTQHQTEGVFESLPTPTKPSSVLIVSLQPLPEAAASGTQTRRRARRTVPNCLRSGAGVVFSELNSSCHGTPFGETPGHRVELHTQVRSRAWTGFRQLPRGCWCRIIPTLN